MVISKLKKLVAVAAVALFATNAIAMDINPKFYVGAEAKYAKFGYNDEAKKGLVGSGDKLKKKAPGAGIFAGAKLNEFFGVEAGYEKFKAAKHKYAAAGKEGKTSVDNMYFDVMGYYPVAPKVELIGSVGVGRAKVKTTYKVAGADEQKFNQTKVGPRVGAGVKYSFNENFSARAMVRWQKVGGVAKNGTTDLTKSGLKSITSVGVGVAYEF